MAEKPLAGQVALVTGAARRIGRGIALRLAAEGARVAVHYRTRHAEAQAVAARITDEGGDAFCVSADLTRLREIEALFSSVENRFARLDILINAAAAFFPTPLPETSEEQWDTILDANLKSQFFCAQRAAPLLRAGGRGRIINFASLGGLLPWPRYIAYCTSKAGVIMLTRCLARALAPQITVNAVAPGTISFPGDPPELAADYIQKAPLRRTGSSADINDAVMYLLQASFVTGQVLAVDGGRSLSR